jgi:hypothetical protein
MSITTKTKIILLMKKLYFITALLGITAQSQAQGITFTPFTFGGTSNICCVADMNHDYLDDVVTVSSTTVKIYSQNLDGTFTTNSIPLSGTVSVADWSIAAGDYDRNGYTDIALGNGSRLTVLKASDDGTNFTIVAYPENIFTQRTNFVDMNNDGNLDLWACHDVNQSHPYKNDGNGNLILDYSLFPTSNEGGNYATIWTDYDNDGDVDMYEAKCRGGAPVGDARRINLLYQNDGTGTYTDVAPLAGVNDGAQSWSTAVEDFDNDGDMDFLLSNISDQNRMYRNNGDGTFTDIYSTTGIDPQVGSWELQAADFNNDGFVDFFWQNGKELYLNNGNMTFTGYDLAFSEGALGDLNNDGFLDVQMGSKIYFNSGNPNKWLKVQLQGVESNIHGIAARVEIYGAWGKQIREIRSGQGFSHMSTMNAHFGIGTASGIDKVIVRWPSGTVDEILNVSSNQSLTVVEGAFPLSTASASQSKLRLAPNPAKETVYVQTTQIGIELTTYQIFDLSGRNISNGNLVNQSIQVSNLANGTYFIQLTDKKGNQYTEKFIKN